MKYLASFPVKFLLLTVFGISLISFAVTLPRHGSINDPVKFKFFFQNQLIFAALTFFSTVLIVFISEFERRNRYKSKNFQQSDPRNC
jgi:hypothetical protein